ncbi:MAG: fibronectin type III domain-containing protein, partial [Phaeodactylibacter sp.]|nr:fibronectin type III domain-containing protein [Phaeodactylibacter sp.]
MRFTYVVLAGLLFGFAPSANAQETGKTKANYVGTVGSVEYVTSLASRPNDLIAPDNSKKEAKDKRSLALENQIIPGKDPQTEDDYFVKNRHEAAQSKTANPPSLVFDAYSSNEPPTDPSLAVGPNHVLVVFNTGFAIYDKSGGELVAPAAPNPAIFPSGGCCDLTVSYDNAADRWILTFLGAGAQIAISDGPDPVNDGWYIYTIPQIEDYQKLSVWSDAYYITDNAFSNMRVWALERAAMLSGDPSAGIINFDLPGLTSSGFYSPQVLNVTDSNLPDPGGATVVYLQDDGWFGVATDHVKLWTIDVDWTMPGSSTVSAPQEIPTTPFINVFDAGEYDNLAQPGGGAEIDALQATIMNQAQFRKFGTHNSAVFNFVVDVDAGPGELAAVRWMELRQSDDNQPWSLYQEGTYTAPDGRHAWNASLAMDGQGNIGMGYTSMSGTESTETIRVSSYYTGRMADDPLGTMTLAEELIGNGLQNIPNFRYGDYSKIDVDPADEQSFWYITEYMKGIRTGIVGVFQIQSDIVDVDPPSAPADLMVSAITTTGATLDWTASIDNIAVDHYNIFIDGGLVGTSPSNTFLLDGLSPGTTYTASVNAEDAAGNTSGDVAAMFTTLESGGLEVLVGYYFETGLDGWSDPGEDCRRTSTNKAYEGSYAIRLRDGTASSFSESPVLDLTGNTEVSIELHTFARSMEADDQIVVEFFNGLDYDVVASYSSGSDFSNLSFFSPSHIVL